MKTRLATLTAILATATLALTACGFHTTVIDYQADTVEGLTKYGSKLLLFLLAGAFYIAENRKASGLLLLSIRLFVRSKLLSVFSEEPFFFFELSQSWEQLFGLFPGLPHVGTSCFSSFRSFPTLGKVVFVIS